MTQNELQVPVRLPNWVATVEFTPTERGVELDVEVRNPIVLQSIEIADRVVQGVRVLYDAIRRVK